MARFAVTAIAHPALRDVREDCHECLLLGHDAAVQARVSGSTGATFSVTKGGVTHSATVSTYLMTYTLA